MIFCQHKSKYVKINSEKHWWQLGMKTFKNFQSFQPMNNFYIWKFIMLAIIIQMTLKSSSFSINHESEQIY